MVRDSSSELSAPPRSPAAGAGTRRASAIVRAHDESVTTTTTTPQPNARGRKRKAATVTAVQRDVKQEEDDDADIVRTTSKPKKTRRLNKVSAAAAAKLEENEDGDAVITTSVARKKRKTTVSKRTTKKSGAMLPIAARTAGARMLVGAHVSSSLGVQNTVTNSLQIGGNAFALFVKNQRRWESPPLKDEDIAAFSEACKAHGYDPKKHLLPHGSYLINLAQSDAEKAGRSYDCFLDELRRCEQLGIGHYNVHPGSTLGAPRSEALGRVAAALNRAHAETEFCKTVVENMVGTGNFIGAAFEDLRDIIAGVRDKSRVGVCLDTCHMFAAGHDIRSADAYEAAMAAFDRIVGRKYLCAMHLNDSKVPLGAKRDLHQNIGLGFLGLEPFRLIMNDRRLEGLPLILETPTADDPAVWAREIKLLESLVGLAPDDEQFLDMAGELAQEGAEERNRILETMAGKIKTGWGKNVKKKKTDAKPTEAQTKTSAKKKTVKKAKIQSDDDDDDDNDNDYDSGDEGCRH